MQARRKPGLDGPLRPAGTRPRRRPGSYLIYVLVAGICSYALGWAIFLQRQGPLGWPALESSLAEQQAASSRREALRDQRRHMSVVDGRPEKFLTFLVCKGYVNQLLALADGIAICHLLNATCVLPRMYRHFDPAGLAARTATDIAHYDPQADQAVGADFFLDTKHLIKALADHVRIVPELPIWLQGKASGSYDEVVAVEAAQPHTFIPYQQLLRRKNVLRLRCVLDSVDWSTERMGSLRAAIHAAVRPSRQVQAAYQSRLETLAATMGVPLESLPGSGSREPPLPYLAVHIRDEQDWSKACNEALRGGKQTMVGSYKECYQTTQQVATQLVEWQLHEHYKHVYVSNTNFTAEKAQALMEAGQFETVASQGGICFRHSGSVRCRGNEVAGGLREFWSAVDLLMMERAPFFVGNAFSSFSFWTRLGRLIKRRSLLDPPEALYYNKPLAYSAGDLQREEAGRFNVEPGTLHPKWHSADLATYYWLHQQQLEGKCLHKHRWGALCSAGGSSAVPVAEAIEVSEAKGLNSGFLAFLGTLRPSTEDFNWHPQLGVHVDGELRGTVTAYIFGSGGGAAAKGKGGSAGGEGLVGFAAEVPILPQDTVAEPGKESSVMLRVCLAGAEPAVCSKEIEVKVSPSLRRDDEGPGDSILYMWFPGMIRSGGPEALHQLHREVNKWHAAGELALRSVFPQGDPFYKGPHSNFSYRLELHQPGPRDYLMVPEHHVFQAPREFQFVMKEVGTQGLVWHVGQHVTRLAATMRGKEAFKPICLSPYFARLLECPQKAIINVPMADVFLEMGREEDAHPTQKEDLVLFDLDETVMFDPTSLKLPPGAQLVLLKGFSRKDVVMLLRKAKVYIDTYLTGNERGVYESALLNVVPIVSNHGPGADAFDFPIPQRYKWRYHDYDQLSDLVRFALQHHDQAVREVRPFKDFIYRMPAIMSENVRTYFQDDVQVVLPLVGEQGSSLSNTERYAAFGALLFSMIQYPFSNQELVIDNTFYAEFDAAGILYHLFNAGLMSSYSSSQLQAEYRRFGPRAVYLQRPLARHFRDYTLILPPRRLPLHPNLAAAMFKAAHRRDYVAVFGPDGVVLADWGRYYDLVNANLWYFDDEFGTEDMRALLEELGKPYLVLDSIGEMPEDQRQAIPWLQQHRCDVITLEVFAKPPASSCFCKDLGEVTGQDLWAGNFNKIPRQDPFRLWLESLQAHCARYGPTS